jgi:flagellar basal-body rod protein FlgF
MDRLIYIAGSGAKHVLEKQATTANNLANASTTGFRAQIDSFRAVPVQEEGVLPTRAFVVDSTAGANFSSGAMQQTGRNLDVAVERKGWFAVRATDGNEAYTRNGSFALSDTGLLQTTSGQVVMGEGGPITVPQGTAISIAKDGTVVAMDLAGKPTANVLGRLKLVNPGDGNMTRREDGLFGIKDGSPAQMDPTVTVVSGAVEGSNVSVVDEMVSMISQGRQFEMQMKLLTTAESDAAKASQILSLS